MATVLKPAERLMTIAEFIALPDDGRRRELVRGRVVEMPQPKPIHGFVCLEIAARLREFVKSRNLGRVATESGLVTEREPDSMRGPDISYYSYERVAAGKVPDEYLDVRPELVVEVLSTFDRWPRVLEKIVNYLDAGVVAVCIVDPEIQTVEVHTANEKVRHLTRSDVLTVPEVLPEFSCNVADLFDVG
jgi:Uma2 family endonuclease